MNKNLPKSHELAEAEILAAKLEQPLKRSDHGGFGVGDYTRVPSLVHGANDQVSNLKAQSTESGNTK
jgi:hypothetical protein